ncbi:MAG: CDP-archaeol synthase [Caulobacter sp.]|nr:CDP-archaeol synthase [Caulobacter sp.]
MTSSQQVSTFDWRNLRIRLISAFAIIPAVVAGVTLGGWAYVVLISLVGGLLAREWARLVAPSAPSRVGLTVGLSVLSALIAAHLEIWWAAWCLLLAGSVAAAIVARGLTARVPDAAYGVIYIGPPGIVMIWLRDLPDGAAWTVFMFAVTWWTDVMAFAVGSALKGPKLWPQFSPNKTWTGFYGGLGGGVLAALVVAVVSGMAGHPFLGLSAAAVIGLCTGLATMGGDLWESMLKRRFGVKDTGGLIPGHGGMLDRVDGLMFAVIVVAAARLLERWGWGL